MEKATKVSEITVRLGLGATVRGHIHTPLRTSSSVRPSDAIRAIQDGFLVLSDVEIEENGEKRTLPALMIRLEAVAYVELPSRGWLAREGS